MAKLVYLYNERLPRCIAHDNYVIQNCLSLANAGISTEVIVGKSRMSLDKLSLHYGGKGFLNPLTISSLPMIRKPFKLPITCNKLFLWASQKKLEQIQPDLVAFSVLKQAAYHGKRKIPGVKYIYEIHQLNWYPTLALTKEIEDSIKEEKAIFKRMDLLTVTTSALKKILESSPYNLKIPIEVIPLTSSLKALKHNSHTTKPTLSYLGRLYPLQGFDLLLEALNKLPYSVDLKVVGGNKQEIFHYKKLLKHSPTKANIQFYGFVPPSQIESCFEGTDIFVTPFLSDERMPYVAHSKLADYSCMNRPIVAPNLSVCAQHTPRHLYTPFKIDCVISLVQAIEKALKKSKSEMPKPKQPNWSHRGEHYKEILLQLFKSNNAPIVAQV